MRWKREKRSNILRIDTLSQFFLYIQSDVFFHQMMMFPSTKANIWENKNLFGSWFVGLSDMLNIPAAEHIWQLFDSFVSFFHTNMFSTKQSKQKMFFRTIVTNVASTHANNVVQKWLLLALLLSNKSTRRDSHSQISNKQQISSFRLAKKREISKTQISTFLTSN